MLVKCRACGQKIDRNNAFKVVVGEKNAYYCNEKEYEKICEEREDKNLMYGQINEIFGYVVTNTALFKEMTPLISQYGYKLLYFYLKENFDYLYSIAHRDFDKEYGKIRYFSVVVGNSIQDYSKSKSLNKEPIRKEIYVEDSDKIQYKRKNKKRSLAEIEQEVGE